jgi:RNA polymerase sigma factor (sigma-70 family)
MDSSTTGDRRDAAGGEGAAALIAALEAGRARFLALVDTVRPDLHRYCARMTGSSADGEDVVQDTLARAYYQVADLDEMPALRPWLFRIAHNLAIDHHRRSVHRAAEPLDAALDVADSAEREPDALLARRQAVRLAIGSFLRLAPAQRACVILKDVLDHSLDEIALLLELSVPSVKSALHRGRAVLRELPAPVVEAASPRRDFAPELVQYARLFGAHDWDGVRAMLADDVRLDLVSRRRAAGRRFVERYFSNYERVAGLRLLPAHVEGRQVLAVFAAPAADRPAYFIEIAFAAGRVAHIRDFRYVPYIMQDVSLD